MIKRVTENRPSSSRRKDRLIAGYEPQQLQQLGAKEAAIRIIREGTASKTADIIRNLFPWLEEKETEHFINHANVYLKLKLIISTQIIRLMGRFPNHWKPSKYVSIHPEHVADWLTRDAQRLEIKNPIVLLNPGTFWQFSVTDRSNMPGIEDNPIYR